MLKQELSKFFKLLVDGKGKGWKHYLLGIIVMILAIPVTLSVLVCIIVVVPCKIVYGAIDLYFDFLEEKLLALKEFIEGEMKVMEHEMNKEENKNA